MRIVLGAAAAAAALVSAGAAQAALLTINNADFNTGPAAGGDGWAVGGHVASIPGWSSGGSSTSHWNPTAAHFADEAAHGAVAYASGALETQAGPSHLLQPLSGYTIEANTRYTLTVDVGRYFGQDAFGYDFGLIAGGLSPTSSILARLTGQNGANGDLLTAGRFETLTLVFQTGASGPEIGKLLTIGLGGLGGSGAPGIAYDNIKLDASPVATTAVPEPATWAMMITGFGLAGTLVRRQRRLQAA